MAASWGNVKLSPASAASMAVMFGAAVSASAFTPSYHLAARSLPCAARAPSLATRRCHPASRPVAGLSRRQGLKQGVGAVGMQVKPGTKDRDDMIVGLDVGGDDSTYSGSPDLDDKAVQQWTAESSLEIIDDTTPEGQARMAQKVKTRGILLMVAALYGKLGVLFAARFHVLQPVRLPAIDPVRSPRDKLWEHQGYAGAACALGCSLAALHLGACRAFAVPQNGSEGNVGSWHRHR